MEEWIQLIGEYGFPIMVTLYLLHRLEKKLDYVATTIEQLPLKLLLPHSFWRTNEQETENNEH